MSVLQKVSTRPHSDTEPETTESRSTNSLTRVAANFTPRAMEALEALAAKTGDSKTDVLNRSVLVYQVFLELVERGGGTLTVLNPDGSEEHLRFL